MSAVQTRLGVRALGRATLARQFLSEGTHHRVRVAAS
jgi:hypothetical protein